MAFETGTANNVADFISKFETFITSHPDLIAAGEAWTIDWTHAGAYAGERVYKGPGLGADGIFVAARYIDISDGNRGVWLRGAVGVNPLATEYLGHVNQSTNVGLALDNNPFGYWFVANGRRFVIVVKISTVYEAAYAGLALPYAPPTTYAYPLFIGGSNSANWNLDWRSTGQRNSHFPFAYYNHGSGSTPTEPTAFLLNPIGDWVRCSGAEQHATEVTLAPHLFPGDIDDDDFEVHRTQTNYILGHQTIKQRTREGFGGHYPLTPVTLMQRSPKKQTFGVLDGVKATIGVNNYVENLLTVGGVDHLVVQNAYRTGFGDYWALALE